MSQAHKTDCKMYAEQTAPGPRKARDDSPLHHLTFWWTNHSLAGSLENIAAQLRDANCRIWCRNNGLGLFSLIQA